jgi:regulator of replication initiation timing
MTINRDDYLLALTKAHEDPEAYRLIESLIDEHFTMIEHMKRTRLFDVYVYEKQLAQPLEILVYDNEKLKKEVNKLRQQLGKIQKYKDEDILNVV